MNNRQTPFAELKNPSYTISELADLSSYYSERADIAAIANVIVSLLADMRRFLLKTELDQHAPEATPGRKRAVDYVRLMKQKGIGDMHSDACKIFNAAAASLEETIKFKAERAPESNDLTDAIEYSKALIQRRLVELENNRDLLHICYKNTSTSENKLKLLLTSISAPRPTDLNSP